MPRNVYWEHYLHFVWRTKDSMPLIHDRMEPLLRKYIVHRSLETPGVIVHDVGGIEDHVHLSVSLPPTIAPANWIGDLKGAASHHINHGPCGAGSLAWQTGYGMVSFGKRDLPWVAEYIRSQREHHKTGSAVERMERITFPDPVPEGTPEEAR
jgi:putative transposase